MGSKCAKKDNSDSFNSAHWAQIPLKSQTKLNARTLNNFKVLKNEHIDNLQVQKYQLCFSNFSEYQYYKECYEWRRNNRYLAATVHLHEDVNNQICSTFHTVSVYTERMPIRLNEIMEVPLNEALYMLQCSLHGYRMIYPKTGYFEVDAGMVCINREGKVKVWLNRDLSKTMPELALINQNKTQQDFIQRVLRLIEEVTDYQPAMTKLSSYLRNNKFVMKFDNFADIMAKYARSQNVHIAKEMQSILILLTNSKVLSYVTKAAKIRSRPQDSQFSIASKTKSRPQDLQFSITNKTRNPPPPKVAAMQPVFKKHKSEARNLNLSFGQSIQSQYISLQPTDRKKRVPHNITFQKHTPTPSISAIVFKYSSDKLDNENMNPNFKAEIQIQSLTERLAEKEAERVVYKRHQSEQMYYTLSEQCELDPEIALDLDHYI